MLDAIQLGNTSAGLRARELCSEAAKKRMDEVRAMEGEEGEKKAAGGLSVEAVAAHTQGASKCTHLQVHMHLINVGITNKTIEITIYRVYTLHIFFFGSFKSSFYSLIQRTQDVSSKTCSNKSSICLKEKTFSYCAFGFMCEIFTF